MPVLSRNSQTKPASSQDHQLDIAVAPPSPAPSAEPTQRRPLPWRWILVTLAALAAVGSGLVMLFSGDDRNESEDGELVQLETVEASQTDLVDYTDLAGTMQYANSDPITAVSDGTITSIVADGTNLTRGDIVYSIDAEPIVVFYSDVPLYRTMTSGDDGDDIQALEENLASLGFHTYQDDDNQDVNTGFVVDGIFDSATEAAVLRFQESYGLDQTGTMDPEMLLVVSGPSMVSSITAELGDKTQPGAAILTLHAEATVHGLYAAHSGDLDLESTTGALDNGTVVYTIDDVPVSAVLATPGSDLTLTRNLYLGVADGSDVAAVEQMLTDLGYTANGDMVVDEEFTSDTTEAINDWEDDLEDQWHDVSNDGTVSLNEIILIDESTEIGTAIPVDSDLTASGTELASATTSLPTRVVTTAIAVADQEALNKGQDVDVEFPDGTVVTGTVNHVATTSTLEPGDPEAEPTLAVEISLPDIPESFEGLSELDVTIKLVDRIATGATVVPASALVATADGGFAVEVATGDGSTQFVAVDPGQFTDGMVEVDGIEPGTSVVVPQ